MYQENQNPNNQPAPSPAPGQGQPVPSRPQQQTPAQNPQNPTKQPLSPQNKQNKPKESKQTNKQDNTSQKSLLISEIRDGIVIMQDGSLRAVVMCQSINFDLMSPQEREGVEFSYQHFLNSLWFPVQIYIKSQHINLDDYLDRLDHIRQDQDNILLGLLMEDYIAYVRYLVEAANIMDKQFYVVVPYYPNALESSEGMSSGAKKFTELFSSKPKDVVTINEADFRKNKQELTQQVRTVVNGLTQIGIQAVPLNTQELIELYYKVYNPVTSKQEQLVDVKQLEAAMIEKGDGQAKQVLPGGSS